jgi:hypothetical protein
MDRPLYIGIPKLWDINEPNPSNPGDLCQEINLLHSNNLK